MNTVGAGENALPMAIIIRPNWTASHYKSKFF